MSRVGAAIRSVRHFFRPGDKMAEDLEASRQQAHQNAREQAEKPVRMRPHQMPSSGNMSIDSNGAYHRQPAIVTKDDALGTFRMLVGISSHPNFAYSNMSPDGESAGRPAPNLGIFTRVVRKELNMKSQHKIFSLVVNSVLAIQIIVAAILTALGAGQSSYTAITAFGALNTIIAGFLSYLKGSGLPGRLKWQQNEWKKIREFVEQRERDLSREGCTLDVYELVAVIEAMYEDTKADIEASAADSYGNGNANRPRAMDNLPQGPGVGQPLSSITKTLQKRGSDIGGPVMAQLDEKMAQAHGQYDKQVSGARNEFMSRANTLQSGLHDRSAAVQGAYNAERQAAANKWKGYEEKGNEFGGKIAEFQEKYGDKIQHFAEDIGRRFAKAGADAGHHEERVEEAARDVHDYARQRMSQLTLRPGEEKAAAPVVHAEKTDEAP